MSRCLSTGPSEGLRQKEVLSMTTAGNYDPQVRQMVEVLTENGFPTLAKHFADEMNPSNPGGPSNELDALRTCVEDAVKTFVDSRRDVD